MTFHQKMWEVYEELKAKPDLKFDPDGALGAYLKAENGSLDAQADRWSDLGALFCAMLTHSPEMLNEALIYVRSVMLARAAGEKGTL